MLLRYFFRRPLPIYYSIEELFAIVEPHLPSDIQPSHYYAPRVSNGLCSILYNCIHAAFRQGEVNHITGDIHYLALLLRKSRTVLTIHDLDSMQRRSHLKNLIIRFLWFWLPIRRVQYITVISDFTKNQLLHEFKIDPKKIIVIPNCISQKLNYSPKIIDKNCPIILQIGTKPNKNFMRVIQAISTIRCKLLVLGHSVEEYVTELNQYQIDYERFFNLPIEQVYDLYRRCDMLCFCSTYEGFGMPIIEAQAIGRAVITSDLSPMKEVAGQGALLVNPYQTAEIHRAITQLITDDNLRNNLITNGLENVKRFSATVVAQQYAEVYRKIKI